jgi:hypothetical protein
VASFEYSLTVDTPQLTRLLRKLDHQGLQGALKNIGEAGVGLARDSFRESKDPYGLAWAPLSDETLESLVGASGIPGRRRRRQYGKRPLMRTRALVQSLNWQLVGGGAVSIGASQRYGVYHQGDPTKTDKGIVPRRMFLPTAAKGLPAGWRDELIDAVESFLDVRGGA